MTIKHLVLSGGGLFGMYTIGILEKLFELNYLNINEIKTIHSTSVGSIMALLLCMTKLNLEYNSISNYFKKRPFHETYKINFEDIINIYNKNGLYDKNFMYILLKPFFETINLSINITMLELYNLTSIEYYTYAIEFESFKLKEFSYKNTPNLPILNAIYMSSTIPMIFTPFQYENKYYIDGGFICNYPMKQCLDLNPNFNEVLGLYYNNKYEMSYNSNLFKNLLTIFYNLVNLLNIYTNNYKEKPNEIPIDLNINLNNYINIIFSEEIRTELYDSGMNQAINYYNAVFKNSTK
jgi:NTE family protein